MTTTSTGIRGASAGRYRRRGATTREHRLTPRFTDEELDTLRAAAEAAGMTVTGFCAMAALTVACRQPGNASVAPDDERTTPGPVDLSDLLRHLFAARVAVNRTGTNLNQAVAALNATGEAPIWLQHAVERCAHAVHEMDVLAARVHRRLA